MPIAMADAGTVHDHGMIQQRPIAVWSRSHALQKIGEHPGMKNVDLEDLGDLYGIIQMV